MRNNQRASIGISQRKEPWSISPKEKSIPFLDLIENGKMKRKKLCVNQILYLIYSIWETISLLDETNRKGQGPPLVWTINNLVEVFWKIWKWKVVSDYPLINENQPSLPRSLGTYNWKREGVVQTGMDWFGGDEWEWVKYLNTLPRPPYLTPGLCIQFFKFFL